MGSKDGPDPFSVLSGGDPAIHRDFTEGEVMILARELKFIKFMWDDEARTLAVKRANDTLQWVVLRRSEMFSLARFILRIAQKGKRRKS